LFWGFNDFVPLRCHLCALILLLNLNRSIFCILIVRGFILLLGYLLFFWDWFWFLRCCWLLNVLCLDWWFCKFLDLDLCFGCCLSFFFHICLGLCIILFLYWLHLLFLPFLFTFFLLFANFNIFYFDFRLNINLFRFRFRFLLWTLCLFMALLFLRRFFLFFFFL
jgi:hypothetical protein